ncbi:MAG: FixH family protein [Sterolibacterium sp.]|nr:FixH family protein [Sterolibacterium sp.]
MTNHRNPAITPAGSVSAPWYKHRWPWLLMAGPIAVVIASFITLWLAIRTDDGLVTENYYRQGLAINRTLKLSEHARSLGLEAGLTMQVDQITLRLAATRTPAATESIDDTSVFVPPPAVRLTISHPTRAGLDQIQTLHRQGDHYSGRFRLPASGHWTVKLEDDAQSWLMMGNILLPADDEQVIGGVVLPEEPSLSGKD